MGTTLSSGVGASVVRSDRIGVAEGQPCHAEHIRYAQCKLREASVCPSTHRQYEWHNLYCHPERSEGSRLSEVETFREVYPDQSECAQHEREFRLPPPSVVTLSEAKGLSRWATRCFATLSMTGLAPQRGRDPSRSLPRAKCMGSG